MGEQSQERFSKKIVRKSFENRLFLIPNLITVIGSFCGFLALISVLRGDFIYAVRCIFIAVIIDGLDGRVARRLNATSAFGREFDSLSDLIAFGVAPAFLLYNWAFLQKADELGVLFSFIFAVCTALRLARFNVRTENSSSKNFEGLPSPAAAMAVISLVYFNPFSLQTTLSVGLTATYTTILSLLMISSIPFPSVKHLKFAKGTTNKHLLFILATAVAFAWYNSRWFLLSGSVAYVVSGLLLALGKQRGLAADQISDSSDKKT